MFKKILAVAMATAMVFSVAQVAPANTTVADAAMITVKEGTIVGKEDRTSAFWSDVTNGLKLDDGQTLTAEFENHGSKDNNWNNYAFAFMSQEDMSNGTPQREDKTYQEWATVRADNYAWGGGDFEGKPKISNDEKKIEFVSDVNWDTFKDVVADSNVVVTLSRVKNLVAVTEVITNIADPTKKITTTTSVSVGKAKDDDTYNDKVYVAFTVDNSYMKFKKYEVSKTQGDVQIKEPDQGQATQPKKTLTLMDSSATTSKVTGELNVAPGKVTVKADTKTFTGTVNGKAFTVKLSGIKAGTKLDLVIEKECYIPLNKTLTAKGTLKISKVKAQKNAKKITGTVSQKKATVKVKVGKKKYKKAKVSGKKFTFKCAKLKKGTTVKIQVTKKNYKTLTKSYKVK
ncbi:MAG: hypothetical protein J5988_05695 [Eubacterium sp.]|nr:hypothetical protein [Eubacterium sp.]